MEAHHAEAHHVEARREPLHQTVSVEVPLGIVQLEVPTRVFEQLEVHIAQAQVHLRDLFRLALDLPRVIPIWPRAREFTSHVALAWLLNKNWCMFLKTKLA